eukprot:EG_transcript_15111
MPDGDGGAQGSSPWAAVDCPGDWVTAMLHLGPPSTGVPGGAMAVDHLVAGGGEGRVRPREGEGVALRAEGRSETTLRWQRLRWAMSVAVDSEPEDRPLQLLSEAVIHYFSIAVHTASVQVVTLTIQHADELYGWVDGRLAFQWDDWDAGTPRQCPVQMQPGWHQLLFKLCERPGGTWFAVRFGGHSIQVALELPPAGRNLPAWLKASPLLGRPRPSAQQAAGSLISPKADQLHMVNNGRDTSPKDGAPPPGTGAAAGTATGACTAAGEPVGDEPVPDDINGRRRSVAEPPPPPAAGRDPGGGPPQPQGGDSGPAPDPPAPSPCPHFPDPPRPTLPAGAGPPPRIPDAGRGSPSPPPSDDPPH